MHQIPKSSAQVGLATADHREVPLWWRILTRYSARHAHISRRMIREQLSDYIRVKHAGAGYRRVSPDAQRDRLRALQAPMRSAHRHKARTRLFGSILELPGLQSALQMLRRGRANTPSSPKPDRPLGLCAMSARSVDELFSDEQHHLLSLCGMVNTHSAAGRMVLMNIASFRQFERELISERTTTRPAHYEAQGIRPGPAPRLRVGRSSRRADVPRKLVLTSEQAVIVKMVALRERGPELPQATQRLNAEQVPARRGGPWRAQRRPQRA